MGVLGNYFWLVKGYFASCCIENRWLAMRFGKKHLINLHFAFLRPQETDPDKPPYFPLSGLTPEKTAKADTAEVVG